MKSATRSAPLLRWLVAACALGVSFAVSGQNTNSAKVLLHQDGTKTVSSSDLAKGELRESTYDSRGMLLSKRIVLLNERGLPVQGVIYTGDDELVGRVQFYYDSLGRVAEERSLNSQGNVFRRKFQLYDQSGKPLSPKIVDYAAAAPKIQSNSINFTLPADGQGGGANSTLPQGPKQPGQAPQIQTVSPRSKTTKPEEKKGLINRIFKK